MTEFVLVADHRSVASRLISNPMPGWYWTRTHWRSVDELKLGVLCDAKADIEASADAIGRSPTSIAHRARDTGLTLPKQWAALIAPKRSSKKLILEPRSMAYPYIAKARPEHADILAINAIVPNGLPESMRGDVCQEIMIAILEGRTTLEQLKARNGTAAYFIRQFYKDNFEQGGNALSFNSADDDRSYDEAAASVAAREWAQGKQAELARDYTAATRLPFTPPNQFEAAWRDQVGRFRISRQDLGQLLSYEEAEELLEAA